MPVGNQAVLGSGRDREGIVRDGLGGLLLVASLAMPWTMSYTSDSYTEFSGVANNHGVSGILTTILALLACAVGYVVPLLSGRSLDSAALRWIKAALIAPLFIAVIVTFVQIFRGMADLIGAAPAVAVAGALLSLSSHDASATAAGFWRGMTAAFAGVTGVLAITQFVVQVKDMDLSSAYDLPYLLMQVLNVLMTVALAGACVVLAIRRHRLIVGLTTFAFCYLVTVTLVGFGIAATGSTVIYLRVEDVALIATLTAASASCLRDQAIEPRNLSAPVVVRSYLMVMAAIWAGYTGIGLVGLLVSVGYLDSGEIAREVWLLVFLGAVAAAAFLGSRALGTSPEKGRKPVLIGAGVVAVISIVNWVAFDSPGGTQGGALYFIVGSLVVVAVLTVPAGLLNGLPSAIPGMAGHGSAATSAVGTPAGSTSQVSQAQVSATSQVSAASRGGRQQTWSKVVIGVGIAMEVVAIVKFTIIGYYPNEFVPFAALMVIGAIMIWAGNKFDSPVPRGSTGGPRPRGVAEKIAAQEFTIATTKSPAEIQAAVEEAAQVGTRFMQTTLKVQLGVDSAVLVAEGGFREQLRVLLDWSVDEDGGRRQVTLRTANYLTTQSKYMFIPVGPKTAPALDSLTRFSHHLQTELR